MTRDTRRTVDRKINELSDDLGTDRSESWRRFISGDLDANDEWHAFWLTAGRDISRAEARQWIRWYDSLPAETQEAVDRASAAGAGVPAGVDRDEIHQLKDAADAARADDPDALRQEIEQRAAEKVWEIDAEQEQEDSR